MKYIPSATKVALFPPFPSEEIAHLSNVPATATFWSSPSTLSSHHSNSVTYTAEMQAGAGAQHSVASEHAHLRNEGEKGGGS